MFRQDQADRADHNVDWSIVGPRDERRRRRVAELGAARHIKTAADHYHAAMVFQHGEGPRDYQTAHELALQAVALGHEPAKWLAAAAEDRYLMSIGQPQRYGTQFRENDAGIWELYTVDSTVTDEERARWNVPPLSEAKENVRTLNYERNVHDSPTPP